MDKKVLIISSSPKNWPETLIFCAIALPKAAQEAKNHIEKISLKNKKINYCTLRLCNSNGLRSCSPSVTERNSIKNDRCRCNRVCHTGLLLHNVRTDENLN